MSPSEFEWPSPEFLTALDLLEQEQPDAAVPLLALAFDRCTEHGHAGPAGACQYWMGTAYSASERLDEALDAFGRALDQLAGADEPELTAACTYRFGTTLDRLGHPADAVPYLRLASAHWAALGDIAECAECDWFLACTLAELGEHAAAIPEFERARDGFLAEGRIAGAADCRQAIAEAAVQLDDPGLAIGEATAASELYSEAGDHVQADQCWYLAGLGACMVGDAAAAAVAFERARRGFVGSDEPEILADCSRRLGRLYAAAEQHQRALDAYQCAAEGFADVGALLDAAECHDEAAEEALALEDASRTIAEATAASDLFTAAGEADRADLSWYIIGFVRADTGEIGAALAAFERARRGLASLDEPELLVECDTHLGDLHFDAGREHLAEYRYDAAITALESAAVRYLLAGAPEAEMNCRELIADAQAMCGRLEVAAELYRDAFAARIASGRPEAAAELARVRGSVLHLTGRDIEAIAEYEQARDLYLAGGASVAAAGCDMAIASVDIDSADHAVTESRYRACLAVFERERAGPEYRSCLGELGDLSLRSGDIHEAERLHLGALRHAVEAAGGVDDQPVADCHVRLGLTYLDATRTADALAAADRARQIYDTLDVSPPVNYHLLVAGANQALGDYRSAEAALLTARRSLGQPYQPTHRPMIDFLISGVFASSGRIDDTMAALRSVVAFQKAEWAQTATDALLDSTLGIVDLLRGDYAPAADRLRTIEVRARETGEERRAWIAAACRGMALLLTDDAESGIAVLRDAHPRASTGTGNDRHAALIERTIDIRAAIDEDRHDDVLAAVAAVRAQLADGAAPIVAAKTDLVGASAHAAAGTPAGLRAALDTAIPAMAFIDGQRFQFARASSRSDWYRMHRLLQPLVFGWAAEAGDATLVADLVEVAINSGCHVADTGTGAGDYLTALLADGTGRPDPDTDTAPAAAGASRLIATAVLPMLPPPRLRMPDGRLALSPYIEAADRLYGPTDRPPEVRAY